MSVLLVAVDDSPALEVVRRKLDDNSVLGEDADVVLAHLSADVGEHLVPVIQFHSEHCVRQGLDDAALYLDGAFLLSHILHVSPALQASWVMSCYTGSVAAFPR